MISMKVTHSNSVIFVEWKLLALGCVPRITVDKLIERELILMFLQLILLPALFAFLLPPLVLLS